MERKPRPVHPASASFWLLALGLLLSLLGYVAPWVAHRVAGLNILGIDLAEYVKFLGEVRADALPVWREGFILPAGALALGCALAGGMRRPWPVRLLLLLAGLFASLTILPPAWTPALLLTPEFRKQTVLLGISLLALLVSPAFGRLPARSASACIGLLQAGAAAVALWQFLLVQPAIDRVYGGTAPLGWGLPAFLAGALLCLLAGLIPAFSRRR